jgi:hypothetical protein
MRKQQRTLKISSEFEGKTYTASYSVHSGAVTVNSEFGSKRTQIGRSSEHTARMLFSEILVDAKTRGELKNSVSSMLSIRSIVHGLGGFGAVFVIFLGFRGIEVNAYLALLCLTLICAAVTDWLWHLNGNIPSKIVGSVMVLVGCAVVWFSTESPPSDRLIRTPFHAPKVAVHAISLGGVCPMWCQDEIDLDGTGILFPIEVGRGFVVMGFSDTPTIMLKDPKPGKVPLPKAMPRPKNAPNLSIDSFEIPPGVKGTLKIRSPQEKFRFEIANNRSHLVRAADRSFLVTLRGTVGEEPASDGQHTIFTYGFSVAEQ